MNANPLEPQSTQRSAKEGLVEKAETLKHRKRTTLPRNYISQG